MNILLCISILVVTLDQLSKTIVANNMQVGESIVLIKNLFSLTYVRNEGAAWGILANHRWIFLVLTAIAIIAIPIITYKLRDFGYFFGTSMALIWGGAIGNMIDRLFYGSVVDFIEATFIDFPVFNIADSCVVVGGIMLFIYLVFINKTLFKSEKKPETVSDEDEEKSTTSEVKAVSAQEGADQVIENSDSEDKND